MGKKLFKKGEKVKVPFGFFESEGTVNKIVTIANEDILLYGVLLEGHTIWLKEEQLEYANR